MKFVFWNIKDNDETKIGNVLTDLINDQKADILLLAETKFSDSYIDQNMDLKFIHSVDKSCIKKTKQLKLYAKKGINVTPHSSYGNGDILCCELEVNSKYYLLFGCHFPSKSSLTDEDKRSTKFSKFNEFIETTEKDFQDPKVGKKTLEGSIVFGDFNVNPFEKCFNHISGLMALDVKEKPRNRFKHKYFINPTMSLIGNFRLNKNGVPNAPGSYFYSKKDVEIPSEFFWNVLDGMFFRPRLLNLYNENKPLEIITQVIKNDKPIHTLYEPKKGEIFFSDHLPIKFNFNIL